MYVNQWEIIEELNKHLKEEKMSMSREEVESILFKIERLSNEADGLFSNLIDMDVIYDKPRKYVKHPHIR